MRVPRLAIGRDRIRRIQLGLQPQMQRERQLTQTPHSFLKWCFFDEFQAKPSTALDFPVLMKFRLGAWR